MKDIKELAEILKSIKDIKYNRHTSIRPTCEPYKLPKNETDGIQPKIYSKEKGLKCQYY